MTDQDIIDRFESGNVPESEFHHADHVRLAFAYLRTYQVLVALEKFSATLKEFAARHGKDRLYNETITCAYIFLVAERIAKSTEEAIDWHRFAEANPDLMVWKGGILSRYYDDATLKSDLSRRVFILPDRLR